MRVRYNNFLGNTVSVVEVKTREVRVGRAADNDIILDNPFIPDHALLLQQHGSDWQLKVLAPNGCKHGDRQCRINETIPLDINQPIQIFPFTLTLDTSDQVEITADMKRKEVDQAMTAFLRQLHLELLERVDMSGAAGANPSGKQAKREVSEEYLFTLERSIDDIGRYNGLFEPQNLPLVGHMSGACVRSELLSGLMSSVPQGQPGPGALLQERGWSRLVTSVPERERELRSAIEYVTKQLKMTEERDLTKQIDLVETQFWGVWDKIAPRMHEEMKRYFAQRFIKKEIKDIVFGYGPLEDLLRSPMVSEIMVVDSNNIYIEKRGKLEITGRRFISDDVSESIIQRIVARVNKQIDRSRPLVDARLADGSRVNAVIPPLAVRGPCLTVRKFPSKRLSVDDLIKWKSVTPAAAQFLMASVMVRCNIIVAGGTGSGKTTLLNCLSNFIPDKERIITVEDTAELQLQKEHVVRLETKEANIEGTGAYTIRDLVKNTLRMRPDRLVIGECRSAEALDMLQAMNTGHDGSMTTIHANSAEDVMMRLEVLCQMAADLPVESIRRQIASAVDLICQLRRLHDGTRRVVQISEIMDFDEATKRVRSKDIFLLEEHADGGPALTPTGYLPTFMAEMLETGLIDLSVLYR